MRPADERLVAHLREDVERVKRHDLRYDRPARHYVSDADLVLREGRLYEPTAELPDGITPMPPKMCFTNAAHCAMVYGLTYVEGYANYLIPVLHAWCVDEAGRVIDPTWAGLEDNEEERAYMGLEMPASLIWTVSEARGALGVLDDWKNGWPLLEHPWSPEAARKTYERISRKAG